MEKKLEGERERNRKRKVKANIIRNIGWKLIESINMVTIEENYGNEHYSYFHL